MLQILDIMMRNAATGVFLFIAVLIIRDYGWRLGAVLGALASLTAATYTICTQTWFDWHTANFFWLVMPFCIMGPVHVWLFSLSQFQDDFTLKPVHIALVVAYIVLQQLNSDSLAPPIASGTDVLAVAYALLRFGFIAHMVFVAWQGRADDLLESRRKFRTTYIVLVSLTIFTIFLAETFYMDDELRHPWISFVQASAFFVLSFVIIWHASKTRDGILVMHQTRSERKAKVAARSEQIDPADQFDLNHVEKLVAAEKMYLEPGLTISKLAESAKLPEHRLRKLINQHMGYRNFSDFLNRYRIEEAQRRLADAENRNTQVLVIAMDLGYGSLGPFNRAFKERTGQTPTEYRRQALMGAD